MDPIQLIGFLGAAGTTFAFLPQSIKVIKSRHTKDLSLAILIMMEAGVIFWLIYGVLDNDVPIIAANTVSIFFVTTTLWLKIKYK